MQKNGYYPPLVIDLDKKKSSGIKEDETGAFSQYLWNKYQEKRNYFKDAYSFYPTMYSLDFTFIPQVERRGYSTLEMFTHERFKYLVERFY